jgi:hypothetical protein
VNLVTVPSASSASGSTTSTGTCASGSVSLKFVAEPLTIATTDPYKKDDAVCFTASTTSLAFSGKTLTSPVQNTAVTGSNSAYKFTDSTYNYEVVFKSGVLYEINVTRGATYIGQFN